MKAKDYFDLYIQNKEDSPDVKVYKALIAMFNEIGNIREERNVNSDNRIISIFNEMNQKANSFIKMVNTKTNDFNEKNGLINDAFKIFVELECKDLFDLVWGKK